ncbi:hypothetical protein PALU110988_11510 [Paenibacillus lupini]|uniref:hypothetical protein n=1 Tax=Paenibacillus lupini TaxID=1450204 RepID=UPI00141E3F94|nr:hypothetical protein [Paenibacillus lupini]NIK21450.1 archaellum component FlaF (FlaF/FlaG flagellin family) [Paenibacillus lupini]
MKTKRFVRRADSFEQIHAAVCHPVEIDFSERIMQKITAHHVSEPAALSTHRKYKPNRVTLLVAIIAISFVVLSGFMYAAVSSGWVTLKDKNGKVTLTVESNLQGPVDEESVTQMKLSEGIINLLKPGESAVIAFGEDAGTVERTGLPIYTSSTSKPFIYNSVREISSAFMKEVNNIAPPIQSIGKAVLTNIKLQTLYDSYLPNKEEWIYDKDEATGYPYAYQKIHTPVHISGVVYEYSDTKATYQTWIDNNNMNLGSILVDNPSSSNIIRIEGQEIYRNLRKDSKIKQYFWSAQRNAESDRYNYMVNSSDASDKELRSFTKAFIKAYQLK